MPLAVHTSIRKSFWYPPVDLIYARTVYVCEHACPQLVKYDQKHYQNLQTPRVFAAYSKDEDIRMDSTSGGYIQCWL